MTWESFEEEFKKKIVWLWFVLALNRTIVVVCYPDWDLSSYIRYNEILQ